MKPTPANQRAFDLAISVLKEQRQIFEDKPDEPSLPPKSERTRKMILEEIDATQTAADNAIHAFGQEICLPLILNLQLRVLIQLIRTIQWMPISQKP